MWCPPQPGGEFRVVYLYTISNSEEVRSAMGSAAEPTVQPTIQEVGPYYYAVTWNYTDLVRATSASSCEHICGCRSGLQPHSLGDSMRCGPGMVG